MSTFFDQLNRKVVLQQAPQRIVSLVPSQTELLVDLGLRQEIVGVTKFCVHPEDLRKTKKIVGGTKKVKIDRIKDLNPDIILCNKEENTEEMVHELEQISPVHVSDVKTIDDALSLILQYGEMFRKREKATEISENIRELREDFVRDISLLPRKRVAYFIWQNPYMVVGRDTFINHLLELNGLENVFLEEDSRYPEVELEQLEEREVDLVLLSSEPFPFEEKHKKHFLKKENAFEIYLVDGEYFSWYGSRLLAAFGYFRGLQSKFWSS